MANACMAIDDLPESSKTPLACESAPTSSLLPIVSPEPELRPEVNNDALWGWDGAADACLALDHQPVSNNLSPARESTPLSASKVPAASQKVESRPEVDRDTFSNWIGAAAPRSNGEQFASHDKYRDRDRAHETGRFQQNMRLDPDPASRQHLPLVEPSRRNAGGGYNAQDILQRAVQPNVVSFSMEMDGDGNVMNWGMKESMSVKEQKIPQRDPPRIRLEDAMVIEDERYASHTVREEDTYGSEVYPYTRDTYETSANVPHHPSSASLRRAAGPSPAQASANGDQGVVELAEHIQGPAADMDPLIRPYSIAVPPSYYNDQYWHSASEKEEFTRVQCSFTTRQPATPLMGARPFIPRMKGFYPPRPTELMVVVDLNTRGSLVRTLQTLIGEIGALYETSAVSWKNVVVCLVGHMWLDHVRACLPMLEEMGIYPSWDPMCRAHPTLKKPRVYEVGQYITSFRISSR
jgi:hypothetical protein